MKIISELNRLGYKAINQDLQDILFPGKEEEISRRTIETIKQDLSNFGLTLPNDQENQEFEVPDFAHLLQGKSPREFLDDVVLAKYKNLKTEISDFLSGNYHEVKPPSRSVLRENLNPGWTRFPHDLSESPKPVETPLETYMVADVETYVKMRGYPVMGAALTSQAYYVWLHPSLLSDQPFRPMLIPMGQDKVIINHNVSYDAARFQESYNLTQNKITLIDTMSMHIAVSGMGNQQRLLYKSRSSFGSKWKQQTSPNNLIDVYNHHVKPNQPLTEDDKTLRNIFVVGNIANFKDNLLDLIGYNLLDDKYTYEMASKLWPKYLYANPETFTLAGHIQLNSSVLPVVENWDEWVYHVNQVYANTKKEVDQALTELAHQLVQRFKDGTMELDLWNSQLDWTEAKSGKNKGQPLWYRKQVLSQIKKKGKFPVGVKSNLAPILLKMSWRNSPLISTKKKGWCYLADAENSLAFEDNGMTVAKLPHPKGDTENVGSPLAKDYIKFIEEGILSSPDPRAKEIMQKAKSLSYWSSMHSRVEEFYTQESQDTKTAMIKPGIVAHGTVTRRAVEPTWLTCSDIKPAIIGSELKSRVQAPEGYVLVGADFDGQELRIGAAKADARMGIHGSSAMSLTQMVGDKDKKTDGHSLLAKDLGLWPDRQLAKTLNFLMLFFGGLRGLFEAIKTARPDLADDSAKTLANKALTLRRGKRDRGTGLFSGGTDSHAYNYMLKMAETPENRTILGKSAISKPLQKTYCDKEFMPSRCNRGIQSAGVDILHVFVSLLEYFIGIYNVEGKFLISIHDETWTMAKEEHAFKMSWIFQLCHMLVWSIFFEAYGFQTIPFNYLFFSSVNIDKVLRKEVNNVTVKVEDEWIYQGLKTASNEGPEVQPGKSSKVTKLMEQL
jgi:DNA polymerase gamma 1